ncbi:exoribonuclease [Corynebacterium phocae]|uniref:Exoribonuclease n=1 Tax=Corynebacterium phocae TaxID=161895 RepID=A0A1L7D223_9CORY|nr:RNB domain-containing ribonuclease [Corynebacterium phocae]APT92154.1 exoribonuclease [Corynebacterium phocae]KAA8725941.1 RNB domain-containing ribonuclease [Corynebacterium phocae]
MKLYAAPLDFDPIAQELGIERGFSPQHHQLAREATDRFAGQRADALDIPLVTIDPEGSQDLDQAVCIKPQGDGYVVYYAIADVAAFIEPGSPLEDEGFKRGQTIYLPDEPARLHPEEISEDKASLLPGVPRPAVLWTFHLDADGEVKNFTVERAQVKSRAQLNYAGVHQDLLQGQLHPSIALLPTVGQLRQQSSRRRGAISLRMPAQRVAEDPQGRFELVTEPRLEVMDYNSEISLLTGMCAGNLIAGHGVGLLRTLPDADEAAKATFVAEAAALGYEVTQAGIGEFLRTVAADSPQGMAVMREALYLLRGAGYAWLPEDEPETRAGIGGYYAHVTAPLRRLCDRFATEVCLSITAGQPIPEWVSARAQDLKETMHRTTALAHHADRACLNLTIATVLKPWVGHNFPAVILDSTESKAKALITQPPLVAGVIGSPEPGTNTAVTLVRAEIEKREVAFAWPAD